MINKEVKELYEDYEKRLKEFEQENNLGRCVYCVDIANQIKKVTKETGNEKEIQQRRPSNIKTI